ncbi:MAG: RluA family pseudouridine synthase [Phycisphaerales bacterium JB037]
MGSPFRKTDDQPSDASVREAIAADEITLPGGKVDPEALRARWEDSGSDDPLAVRFVLQRDLQSRLDKYLTGRITFMSRTQVQRLIDEGGATVNGRVARSSTKLRVGDAIEIELPPPPSSEVTPEEIPLEVLFEDEHLIVLNKQADLIVHPARSELSGTMINALAWHFRHASSTGGTLSSVGEQFARPGVVHRLDRNTTGCIVFAKTDEAHWKLGQQFERRTVDKRYLALVQGAFEPEAMVIEAPIGPHPSKAKGYREKMVVRHDDLGKPSVTIARVHERYRLHDRPVGDQAFSLVELELKTGRTHQIRVHLSHTGFPIVGDDMYGGRAFAAGGEGVTLSRQALHAALLAFEHPISREPLAFTAPLPGDVRAVLEHLRTGEVSRVFVPGTVPLGRLGIAAEPAGEG